MAKRRRRKKRQDLKIRLIRLAIVFVIVLMLGLSVRNVIVLRQEQRDLEKANAELAAKKIELQQELKNVNNKNYIEEQARQQLKLIKPGETLFVLGDEKAGADEDGDTDQETEE